MFFFDPSSLQILVKFSNFFRILLTTIRSTNGEKYRKVVGTVFEKISLLRFYSNFQGKRSFPGQDISRTGRTFLQERRFPDIQRRCK